MSLPRHRQPRHRLPEALPADGAAQREGRGRGGRGDHPAQRGQHRAAQTWDSHGLPAAVTHSLLTPQPPVTVSSSLLQWARSRKGWAPSAYSSPCSSPCWAASSSSSSAWWCTATGTRAAASASTERQTGGGETGGAGPLHPPYGAPRDRLHPAKRRQWPAGRSTSSHQDSRLADGSPKTTCHPPAVGGA